MSRPMAHARRIAKWTGVVLIAVTLLAYPVNLRWDIFLVPPVDWGFCLQDGQLLFAYEPEPDPESRFEFRRAEGHIEWGFKIEADSRDFGVFLPLWSLALSVAIPTALLWRADRRARRTGGCANCGYDLTGLPADGGAAVCPECGQTRPTPATPPEPD